MSGISHTRPRQRDRQNAERDMSVGPVGVTDESEATSLGVWPHFRRTVRRTAILKRGRSDSVRSHRIEPRWKLAASAAATMLLAAACSSSKSPAGSTAPATSGGGTSASTANAGDAQARAAIAPYVGHPSAFPATAALTKTPAPGTQFIYLQFSSPICALIGQLLIAPTKALGITLSVINSGSTATSAQAAAAAALAKKPAAVLIPAGDPQLFGDTLHQLVSAGIAVVGGGIVNGKPYGVQQTVNGDATLQIDGKLMADWVTVNKGSKADVVYFGVPELSFSKPMQEAFKTELAQTCPSCKADYQQLSITTIGNTAPSRVVSYLQAHPSINTVVFGSMDSATGLAAALKVAGTNVTTLGFAPSPSNLQDIKAGGLTAGLGDDLPVEGWMYVNVAARLLAHQAVDPAELVPDRQFLTKQDVTSMDTAHGWTGYPDVAQRFVKLWRPTK